MHIKSCLYLSVLTNISFTIFGYSPESLWLLHVYLYSKNMSTNYYIFYFLYAICLNCIDAGSMKCYNYLQYITKKRGKIQWRVHYQLDEHLLVPKRSLLCFGGSGETGDYICCCCQLLFFWSVSHINLCTGFWLHLKTSGPPRALWEAHGLTHGTSI